MPASPALETAGAAVAGRPSPGRATNSGAQTVSILALGNGGRKPMPPAVMAIDTEFEGPHTLTVQAASPTAPSPSRFTGRRPSRARRPTST